MQYLPWQPLKKGDVVAIVAPSFRVPDEALDAVKKLLLEWGLVPKIPKDIWGEDLLCANTDEKRFEFLKDALLDDEVSAVWAIKGGYGCARLIDKLMSLPPPKKSKLFIGFSDITVLHIFLKQVWGWQTLHGPMARQVALKTIAEKDIHDFHDIIFGKKNEITLEMQPLNSVARQNKIIESIIVGGNLNLVQTSIGTRWQLRTKNNILFLEDVHERGYRVDRTLVHLEQAGLLKQVHAIVFGDFTGGEEAEGPTLIEPVLKRFAENCAFPVFRCEGIGHGHRNYPLPLATQTTLDTSKKTLNLKIR